MYQIKIHNKVHSKAVQERLFELGYERGVGGRSLQNIEYPYIVLDDHKKITYALAIYGDGYKPITLEDLYTNPPKPIKPIKLNDELEATREGDYLKVGCQSIHKDNIKSALELFDSGQCGECQRGDSQCDDCGRDDSGDLEVGDRVVALHRDECETPTDGLQYVKEMERYIGKTGTVVDICGSGWILVSFGDHRLFKWEKEWLVKIK